MAHLREKVRKSASARDSHARRICLGFPRERPWRSPWPGAAVEKVSSAVTGPSTWPRRAKIRHCLSCRCLPWSLHARIREPSVCGISLNREDFVLPRPPPLFFTHKLLMIRSGSLLFLLLAAWWPSRCLLSFRVWQSQRGGSDSEEYARSFAE